MKHARAVTLAIRCIEREVQRLAIDANLHDVYDYVIPRTIAASKERAKLREAIETLKEPHQARMKL